MSKRPVRQDYITKVRYLNTLPPPALNPKYIQYNTLETLTVQEESEQLTSSLFRKQNFTQNIAAIDAEYGMNLNLINNPGVLSNDDVSSILALLQKKEFKLHPKDQVLLRDAGVGKISKSEPGVSFLRRTEYISDMLGVKKSTSDLPASKNAQISSSIDRGFSPEDQLAVVEKTFDEAQYSLENLGKLSHPRKKSAKAVAAWPFLPDTSMLDSKFLTIKFSGSASVTREQEQLKRKQKGKYNEQLQRDLLETAIFKPITTADGEWMSLYEVKDSKEVDEVVSKLRSTEREKPVTALEEEAEDASQLAAYKFNHYKNYDMHFERYTKPYQELAIKFVPIQGGGNGSKRRRLAYYYPMSGKIDLKKHRASQNTEINRFLRDNTADVVNFRIREPTTNELKLMDNLRSRFDPMEYEGEEEDDDDVDADALDGDADDGE